jgi:hypothetical protein
MVKLPLIWHPKPGADKVITQIICTDDAELQRLGVKQLNSRTKQVLKGPVVINGERRTAYVIDSPADGSIKPLEGLT